MKNENENFVDPKFFVDPKLLVDPKICSRPTKSVKICIINFCRPQKSSTIKFWSTQKNLDDQKNLRRPQNLSSTKKIQMINFCRQSRRPSNFRLHNCGNTQNISCNEIKLYNLHCSNWTCAEEKKIMKLSYLNLNSDYHNVIPAGIASEYRIQSFQSVHS